MLSESERCPSLIVVFVEELTVFFVLFVCLLVCLFLFFLYKEMKDFAFVTLDCSLGIANHFLHFHPGSRTLRVTGQGRVWW